MSSNTLIVGAVLLTAGLVSAQEPTKVEFQKQQEMKLRQIAEEQGTWTARVPLEGKTVTGAPYTAEFVSESVQVLPDGNRIVRRSTGRVYRDGQGRIRREEDIEPGKAGHISITDPVAKASYSLDPETKVAWTTPVHVAVYIKERAAHASTDPAELELRHQLESELAAQKRQQLEQQKRQQQLEEQKRHVEIVEGGVVHKTQPEWDEKVERLEAREIEGVVAEGTRTTRTIPAGAIGNEQPVVTVTEEWRSPELQVLVLTQTTDPRTGESTYKLTSISRAEPHLSWFEVPADYTVKETGVRKAAGVMRK